VAFLWAGGTGKRRGGELEKVRLCAGRSAVDGPEGSGGLCGAVVMRAAPWGLSHFHAFEGAFSVGKNRGG